MALHESVEKKVIILRNELLPYSETFVKSQYEKLKKWHGVLLGKSIIKNGLDLTGVNYLLLNNSSDLFSRIKRKIFRILNIVDSNSKLLLSDINANLIHIHTAIDAVNNSNIIKYLNLPTIITLHGCDINIYKEWWERGNGGRGMKSYPRRLISLSSEKNVYFIAVSEAIKNRAIEYGLPKEKITVSYIGVDCYSFTPSSTPVSKRKQVLFVGRLVEKKGCEYLLEAFKSIQDKFLDIDLVVVGNGPQELILKKYAEEHSVRVNFMGALDRDSVKKEMAKSRVFCLPSITAENGDAEGLPIVILEAQSCGIPVITSARGGATEGIIDGVTGYAHKEKDVTMLMTALEKILSDDVIADNMSINARAHILEKMNIDNCTRQLESIYDKCSNLHGDETR